MGLEPTWDFSHDILSVALMPIQQRPLAVSHGSEPEAALRGAFNEGCDACRLCTRYS